MVLLYIQCRQYSRVNFIEKYVNLGINGICSVTGFKTMLRLFQVILLGGKKIGVMEMANPYKKDLVIIEELLEAVKVVPVIDRPYT